MQSSMLSRVEELVVQLYYRIYKKRTNKCFTILNPIFGIRYVIDELIMTSSTLYPFKILYASVSSIY